MKPKKFFNYYLKFYKYTGKNLDFNNLKKLIITNIVKNFIFHN